MPNLPLNPLQTNISELFSSANAVLSSVASNVASVTLLAANQPRKGAYIFNDGTANLFVAYAAVASATAFSVKIPAGSFWEMPTSPIYTGIITGIWDVANGSARITELL